MNIISLTLLFISFIIIILYEFKLKSISVILWLGLFLFFFFPHLITYLLNGFLYEIETYNKATYFSLFFNVLYLYTRIFLLSYKNSLRTFLKRKINSSNSKIQIKNLLVLVSKRRTINFINLLLAFFIISIIFFLIFIFNNFSNLISFTWIDIFNAQDDLFYLAFIYSFNISIPVVFFSFKFKRYRTFLFSLFFTIFLVLLIRVRSYLIAISIPFFLSYLILNPNFKFNFKYILISLLSGFSIIVAIFSVHVLRVYGTLEFFLSSFRLNDFINILGGVFLSPYGEFGLRNAFYHFLQGNNNFNNFGEGLGYIRLLLLPIPSILSFGLKPQDFAMDMAYAYDPVNAIVGVTSMHPTLYGDSFANFGWYGILTAIFWALFVYSGDLLIKKQYSSPLFFSLFVSLSYSYTLIARGAVYNGVYNTFFTLITHLVLWIIVGLFSRKSKIKISIIDFI